MFAVFKRDLISYFTTPIGYVFMAIFLAINGGLFSLMTLQAGNQSSITGYFSMVTIILAIVIPVLTMKTFSEERSKRQSSFFSPRPSASARSLQENSSRSIRFSLARLYSERSLTLRYIMNLPIHFIFGSLRTQRERAR